MSLISHQIVDDWAGFDRAAPALYLTQWLRGSEADCTSASAVAHAFECLASLDMVRVPVPGTGETLLRWDILAEVAAHSLPLVKLYEAHLDALAILDELNADPPLPDSTWGVFAAESPGSQLIASDITLGRHVLLHGVKHWCSGAASLSHALVTTKSPDGVPLLVQVDLRQAGVGIFDDAWKAVGMAFTRTSRIEFDQVEATIVGPENAYLARAGFWQGALGIAACWYGAARFIADATWQALAERTDPHARAHLGAIVTALHAARCSLVAASAIVDASPKADVKVLAMATRAVLENAGQDILMHAGRALGARPFCTDVRFASMAADFPVFLRQSHAEADLRVLGEQILQRGPLWSRLQAVL